MQIYLVSYPWWVRLVTKPIEVLYRVVHAWSEKHARHTPVNQGGSS